MFQRSLIVWKLSAIFIAIILLVFAILGYVNNLVDEHYALASARGLYRLNTATIHQNVKTPLMTRDNDSIKVMLDDLVRQNAVYTEIRLVSHEGRIAVSLCDSAQETLPETSRPCQVCHRYENLSDSTAVASHDEIIDRADGSRVVSVITPFFNEPSCRTAECHAHADAEVSSILGFLQTDYSLSGVDALTAARNWQTAIAALLAIVLGTLGTWLMVGRLLERPLQSLIAGMDKIAHGNLDVRMDVRRKDEFSTVANSFNDMTSKLQLLLHRLRETRDHLESVVENSADIIITVNPSGFIQTFNTGAEMALGYTRDEVIGQRIEKLFADPRERDVAIAQLKDSDHVVNYETHFLTKNGEVREVLLTLSRLRGPHGLPIGTFGISKDITNEKKLQRQLIESERLAAIGQSFTALQHAMKNEMNALTGGSYMVRKGIEKNDRQMLADGWAMVEEGISSISDLSKHLLRYVKEWEPDFEWISMADIIGRIESPMKQTAADKGIAFRTEVSPDLPRVFCDPSLIHTAIMDIVSNAVEACFSKDYPDDEAAQIDLIAAHLAELGGVRIEIRDNGPGMSETTKANIFTPFFSTKKKKGAGLGLALTSRIVSLHGGSIDVVSEPGRGCAFRIRIPVAGPGKNKEHSDGEEGAGHR